jgi:GT2 family glycosyltransferase
MAVRAHGLWVSIVTVVLNCVRSLEGNLRSVAAQDYPWREHLIIDGGSTDGSVELLRRHADRLSFWHSGPDAGIGDAMNKGVARARGDLVLFLHGDDRFLDASSLSRAMRHVVDSSSIWAFDIQFDKGSLARRVSARPFNVWTRFKNPLPHQGVLCPRDLFDRLGGFDTSLHIDMDYDFWLRAYLAGVPLHRVPQVLAVMGGGGVSSRRDWVGLRKRLREERRVQAKYADTAVFRALYAIWWPLYLSYRRMRLVTRHLP